MARALYTLLWMIALPLVPLRLWWRGRKEPGYRTSIDYVRNRSFIGDIRIVLKTIAAIFE